MNEKLKEKTFFKVTYLQCLKKLKYFRKSLNSAKEIKKGRLYFSWIKIKTEKITYEKDNNYIYENIVKYALVNYKIDEYSYKKADKELKRAIDNNYVQKRSYYIFNNYNICYEDAMLIAKNVLLKRGNVVWIDFGFNIGNEFGGMHPAVILRNFENELFVVPVSSKMPKEYKIIEKDFEEGKISKEECDNKKNRISEIIQLNDIIGFKKIIRWANITRIRKVSVLRLNFSGTIGRIEGKYMSEISRKIREEF